jgi:PKD repeat protein
MRKVKRYLPAILILVGLVLGGCAWLLRPLEAKLTANPTSGPAPLSVTFSAAGSTGAIVSFTLDFGDGSSPYSGTDLTVNISHTYTTAGTYTAVLTVQDAAGHTATDSKTITVLSGTTASLSASPSSPTIGETVTFTLQATAASGRTLVSWKLEYGDGSEDIGTVSGTSMNITRTHSYSSPGTYSAKLTVKDSTDYEATAQVSLTVTTRPPEITSFTVVNTADSTQSASEGGTLSIVSGTQVKFSFTAVGKDGRKITKWTLETPGADVTSETRSVTPTSSYTSPDLLRTYTLPSGVTQTQSYTATLTVWDDATPTPKTDTASITIEVAPGP